MPSRPNRFGFTVASVTVAHIVVIVLLLAATAGSFAAKKPPLELPVEFIVAVDDGPEMIDIPPPPPPEVEEVKVEEKGEEVKPPEPEVAPEPAPIPEKLAPVVKPPDDKLKEEARKKEEEKKELKRREDKKKEDKRKEDRKKEDKRKEDLKKAEKLKADKKLEQAVTPIQKGRRITAPNPNPPPPNIRRLSQAEIGRLLALGATPGNRNVSPEGDALYFEVIRRKLYKAWLQPGSVPQNLTAEVDIFLSASGEILSRRMARSSGNRVMDDSVMDAVKAVPRIEGLSPDFLSRWRKVTVTFELTTGQG